jgi:hypothetical protein
MKNTITTPAEAIQISHTKWWETKGPREVALFQLNEDLLCMPFSVFHECVEKAAHRSVFTHELAFNRDGIIKEILGEAPMPSFEDILNLLPNRKTVIISV